MTRRDYVRIAAALAAARQRIARIEEATPTGAQYPATFGLQIATEALADALAADNPRFDVDRFTAAAEAQR